MSENLLERVQAEIARKEESRAAIDNDLAELRAAAAVARALPKDAVENLGAAVRVLMRFAETIDPSMKSNGQLVTPIASSIQRKNDLAGKRIMQAAKAVLEELPAGKSMHYNNILKAAQARGFTSNHKDSNQIAIQRSFYQTIASDARAKDGVVERTGEGMFRLRAKAKADEG